MRALTLTFFMALSYGVSAQCVNTVDLTCGFYETCYEKFCPCKDTPHSYALNYGKKYCKRFLALEGMLPAGGGLTTQGLAWRDSTLRCLQESIIPHLDLNNPQACDCKKLKGIAVDTHVTCYTKPQSSICDLPAADKLIIKGIIDHKDLFDSDGWVTMFEVASACLSQNPSQFWTDTKNLLKSYVDGN